MSSYTTIGANLRVKQKKRSLIDPFLYEWQLLPCWLFYFSTTTVDTAMITINKVYAWR